MQRVTVLLDNDIYDKIKVLQGIQIAETRKDVGVSQIINQKLREYFKQHVRQ